MNFCLQIKNLEFSYPEGSVFKNLNLELSEGERVFLSGPSGCGKSTLLSLCAGMLQPDSGKIAIKSQDFSELDAAKKDQIRAESMGFLFQAFNLIPYLSALENVLLPLRISPIRNKRVLQKGVKPLEEAKRLLQAMNLDKNLMLQLAMKLSIGQQQRVAAARALIGQPGIIFADEPTSALDPPNAKNLLNLLLSECKNNATGLLLVSHHPESEKDFDRHIYFSDLTNTIGPT